MKDATDIKRQNKAAIRALFIHGMAYTKQEIAQLSGLSVASCNTYLNEMEEQGEILGEKQRSGEVGRSPVRYCINEDYESILCVYFELIQGVKSIVLTVLSPTGKRRMSRKQDYEILDERIIREEIQTSLQSYPNIRRIMVGTPSVAEKGTIRHCDIPELNEVPLKAILEEAFHLPVYIANDMHYKVYGYYRREEQPEQIITLVNFPSGVLPGTATVHKGRVLAGQNYFAGMVGFLDYGIDRPGLLQRLQRPEAERIIIHSAIALIAILNPHKMLFTGDLLREGELEQIRQACELRIPKEYMPVFKFLPNTDDIYLAGMYWKAMDQKEMEL